MRAYIMKRGLISALSFLVFLGFSVFSYSENVNFYSGVTNTQINETLSSKPPVLVSVSTKKSTIMMGEPLECVVHIEKIKGSALQGFNYPQPWGDWVLLEQKLGPFQEAQGKDTLVRRDTIKIMTLLDGDIEIPPLIVKASVPGNPPIEFRAAPIKITVKPKTNKKGELEVGVYDIKKPLWLASFWNILWALIIGAVVLLAIWWYSKKTGILGYSEKLIPKRPPEEIALEELENLKKSALLSEGSFKQYYVVLIDILRRYLSSCFHIAATDRTTPELLKELKPYLNRKDLSTIRDLLERGDMIKFAKASPDIKEIDQDWSGVKVFIEETAQAVKILAIENENAVNKKNSIGARS